MEWRYLDTGKATGALNMAIDEAVADHVGRGESPPTVRFYGWDPACLSIGYSQSMDREIDVESCRRAGIDLVRRPTGGRTVLHDDELTYSLIAVETEPRVGGGITESYRKVSSGILSGLAELSVFAEMAPGQAGRRPQYRSAACFDTASSYEVAVGGSKLVGSAQMRRGGVVLQHGSLLLTFDCDRLVTLLKIEVQERESLRDELTTKVTSLEAVAKRGIGFAEAAEALRRGFERALDIRLVKGSLTEEEEALANRLLTEKYATVEWNFRK